MNDGFNDILNFVLVFLITNYLIFLFGIGLIVIFYNILKKKYYQTDAILYGLAAIIILYGVLQVIVIFFLSDILKDLANLSVTQRLINTSTILGLPLALFCLGLTIIYQIDNRYEMRRHYYYNNNSSTAFQWKIYILTHEISVQEIVYFNILEQRLDAISRLIRNL